MVKMHCFWQRPLGGFVSGGKVSCDYQFAPQTVPDEILAPVSFGGVFSILHCQCKTGPDSIVLSWPRP